MASFTTNSIAATTAMLAITLSATSLADDTINLGERVASKEEIIDILKPRYTPTRRIRTRGLQLNSATEPGSAEPAKEAPRSLSLTVNFEFDSASLTSSAIKQLTPLAEALAANELRPVAFILEGHTDAKGTKDYNLTLSDRRAASVKAFLADQPNVDLNRITTTGKGEMELLDSSNPYAKQNRRVVVIAE